MSAQEKNKIDRRRVIDRSADGKRSTRSEYCECDSDKLGSMHRRFLGKRSKTGLSFATKRKREKEENSL